MLCYIGIGSNLGDREKNIKEAIQGLRETKGVEVKRVSEIYETEPVGGPLQPKYLNGVIEIETSLEPGELLSCLQSIENRLGRKRRERFGPRTIDLDILTYGDRIIDEPELKIPHPRMNEREFVLKPLNHLRQSKLCSYTQDAAAPPQSIGGSASGGKACFANLI